MHPIFWSALAVLLVNDHVLKGAGALPGWLTGKLSDLAGLIVAPVALVALLDLRSRGARALAFALVAALFSWLEVSASAAAAWDRALGTIGIASRSWADPSDLVGLAMLPIAWWLVNDRQARHREARDRRRDRQVGETTLAVALQRTALVLATFACVATSGPPPPAPQWQTGAWIHNRTSEPVDVRLRWVEGALSCAFLGEADLGDAAAPEVFGDGVTFHLEPGETVPIEPDDAQGALGRATTGERDRCDLVRVSIDGLDDTVVFWEMGEDGFVPTTIAADADPASIPGGGLAVVERAGALALEGAAMFHLAPLVERAAAVDDSCAAARGEALSHSDLVALGNSRWSVVGRTLLVDGCTEYDLASADDPSVTRTMFFCVPGDFLPFEVGDVIARDSTSTEGFEQLEAEAGATLVVSRGAGSFAAFDVSIFFDDVDTACGARVSCDAFVAPALLRIGSSAVEVGAPFDFTSDGRAGRALVSRAEHVLVAPGGCDAGRARAGTQIDLVLVLDPTTGVP